jgi:NFU1 iron-sulfur cluster scaffold homolog, mitochondrial
VTLKSGIENMLRHYVPEVNDVVQEAEEGAMDLLDMATMNR